MVVEHIQKAWKTYTKNFWQVVGATILFLVLVVGVVMIGFIPILFSGLLPISKTLTGQFQLTSEIIVSLFIFFVAIIAAAILAVALGGGLVGVYNEALKGKAKIQIMLDIARKKFFTLLGANILAAAIIIALYISVALATALINFMLFVVGIIAVLLIAILFSLVNQAVVIDNKKAVDAVKTSVKVVKANYLQFLAIVIILAVISVIVSFVPVLGFLLGWLIVSPVSGIAYTSFYLAKRKIKKR